MAHPVMPLAHAGGVDEFLIFAVPVLVVLYVGLRWWDGRHDSEEGDGDQTDRDRPPPCDAPQ